MPNNAAPFSKKVLFPLAKQKRQTAIFLIPKTSKIDKTLLSHQR
jgi:hypothetical protein